MDTAFDECMEIEKGWPTGGGNVWGGWTQLGGGGLWDTMPGPEKVNRVMPTPIKRLEDKIFGPSDIGGVGHDPYIMGVKNTTDPFIMRDHSLMKGSGDVMPGTGPKPEYDTPIHGGGGLWDTTGIMVVDGVMFYPDQWGGVGMFGDIDTSWPIFGGAGMWDKHLDWEGG